MVDVTAAQRVDAASRSAETAVPVTVARGDGIGPEIMDAVLRVLQPAGARIAPEHIEVGQDRADPSGLLLAAAMMLAHIGPGDVAATVHNAWPGAIEAGAGTYDIVAPGAVPLGTAAFADGPRAAGPAARTMDGVDVFLHRRDIAPHRLAALLQDATDATWLKLQMITNRGIEVWPDGLPETFCTDHWRARFIAPLPGNCSRSHVVDLLHRLDRAELDFVKTEGLYRFDGELGYSPGQGQ